jgi:hypothetical protein
MNVRYTVQEGGRGHDSLLLLYPCLRWDFLDLEVAMTDRWTSGGVRMLVAVLDDLIDVVGENENHPLASLMAVIGVLIEKYEDEFVPELTEL